MIPSRSRWRQCPFGSCRPCPRGLPAKRRGHCAIPEFVRQSFSSPTSNLYVDNDHHQFFGCIGKSNRCKSIFMVNDHLHRACEIVGGQTALADILGVRQSTLHYWLNRSKRGVPAHYVLPIEAATYGAVSRHQLRPDIYPDRVNRKAARQFYRIGDHPGGAS
ncbi:hypothetical protein CHELA1G11_10633 [Hyphomicrobiales bacterium]|nr:hypothetical protein CHELA1G11_10633 [Hyphomicrobiales bacterium]CAH1673308.1 hypothetical protein CHELA1G2_13671 [Hyphomicrobiales bacterium]